MSFAILATCVAFILVSTLVPLSRRTEWIIRDLDFPRLQLAVLALALLVAQFVLLDMREIGAKIMVVITVTCLLYQGWWIFPYTRIYPSEVKAAVNTDTAESIRILTANVLTTNHNAQGLIDLIHEYKPDVFVTLETDAWWQRQLDILEDDYPHAMKCPLDNLYGMHVYSRLPLHDGAIQFLVERDIPSMHAMVELPSGRKVRMHFLHPAPPSPTEHAESTERDAELLIVAKSVKGLDTPVIVAGDLNDVAWSTTTRLFRKISGLLDPRIGRGMFNTFHADHWFLRWPLDHFFHSKHFTLTSLHRLPKFGSDHFPVFIELTYDQARGAVQHGLQADADDKQLAEEKIAAEPVSEDDVHEPQA
ncbi:endonuclease/exonuclease/phosphatase family protein [Massilia sp. PAMC28688]|uniref:endonuclease/exonuclease/phosphatase family protein n=1 Tax=Massilia sp. PAMC28688 TaxID=2861283 RepID=UPI001C638CB5|nr:endonuclease/exonuclease/phosphatase family protein [Massilia sp. PAMC28688]QYF95302.1 endonuclease/exonuclease/phosphatase family protein [Massilia sp. PAMC28688]